MVGTTSEGAVMEEMGLSTAFNVALHVPVLREPEIHTVLATLRAFSPEEVSRSNYPGQIPRDRSHEMGVQ